MSKKDKGFQPPTPEQREAIEKYQKDFRAALPHMTQLATDARRMHQAMLDAPRWAIGDAPKLEGSQQEPPTLWTVGHAKVNYVDHIETTNDEGTQDK